MDVDNTIKIPETEERAIRIYDNDHEVKLRAAHQLLEHYLTKH